jgi:hypothetical protein
MKHALSVLILVLLSSFAVAQNAVAANQAVISFTAPTTYTDGTPITAVLSYGVYQALQGQPKVKVATVLTTTSTITTGLLSGKTYCWQVTAIDGAQESAMSNEACKTFAPPIPNAVTITVQ